MQVGPTGKGQWGSETRGGSQYRECYQAKDYWGALGRCGTFQKRPGTFLHQAVTGCGLPMRVDRRGYGGPRHTPRCWSSGWVWPGQGLASLSPIRAVIQPRAQAPCEALGQTPRTLFPQGDTTGGRQTEAGKAEIYNSSRNYRSPFRLVLRLLLNTYSVLAIIPNVGICR